MKPKPHTHLCSHFVYRRSHDPDKVHTLNKFSKIKSFFFLSEMSDWFCWEAYQHKNYHKKFWHFISFTIYHIQKKENWLCSVPFLVSLPIYTYVYVYVLLYLCFLHVHNFFRLSFYFCQKKLIFSPSIFFIYSFASWNMFVDLKKIP